VEQPHETLPRDVLLGGNVDPGTTCWVHHPLKIWEGTKRPKFGAI